MFLRSSMCYDVSQHVLLLKQCTCPAHYVLHSAAKMPYSCSTHIATSVCRSGNSGSSGGGRGVVGEAVVTVVAVTAAGVRNSRRSGSSVSSSSNLRCGLGVKVLSTWARCGVSGQKEAPMSAVSAPAPAATVTAGERPLMPRDASLTIALRRGSMWMWGVCVGEYVYVECVCAW
jgi:hypothetical protein